MRREKMKVKRNGLSILIIFFMITVGFMSCQAMPANPEMIDITQPSGAEFEAMLHGDEWNNWTTAAEDDYVIMQDKIDGAWKYAVYVNGEIKPSNALVGIDPAPAEVLTGEERKTLPAPQPEVNTETNSDEAVQLKEGPIITKKYYSDGVSAPMGAIPLQPAGAPQKVIVLLVSFTDRTIQSTETDWHGKFFADSGKSVKNYYKENSYGNFCFLPAEESFGSANDGVIKVTLGYAHPNPGSSTGDANRNIVKNALIAADPYINYASFDANGNGYIESKELHIVTIIAGYDRSYDTTAPSVWGHRWSFWGTVAAPVLDGKSLGANGYGGYTQQGENHGAHAATIGILCHELGHDLGAADLYNTSSGSDVVGVSSVMDGGSWGMGTADYPGGCPAHFDPWHKIFLGFAAPQVVSGGIQTMNSASTGAYNVLQLNTSDPNQYFLVENRNKSGFDNGLYYNNIANGGIAIWHITEDIIAAGKASNTVNSGAIKGVWLEKSVGPPEPYFRSGGPKNAFSNTTTPNSNFNSGSSSGIALTVLDPTGTSMRVQIGSSTQLQFAQTSVLVNENAGSAALTVNRTGDTAGSITVNYATADGTATAGSDYTAASGTLNFASGEASKTVTVPILDDSLYENNETFTLNLSSPSSGTIGASTATVTINDDDAEAQMAFNPANYTISEEEGSAALTVVRTGNTTGAITVNYTTANGTATAGADYSAASGTLNFADGEASKTITVPILDDTIYETNKFFTVTLSNASNGVITVPAATVTINDNEYPPAHIAFSPTAYSVAEGGTATVTVNRITSLNGLLTVDYTTIDNSAVGGSDYTGASGTLTFDDGISSQIITIPINDDSDMESSENFTVVLSNASGGAILDNNTATVTIPANDGTVTGPVTKLIPSFTVNGTLISRGVDFTSVGETQAITITANFEGGGQQDVTSSATWTIVAPEVADVQNGVVTAKAKGKTPLNISYGGQTVQIWLYFR